MHSSSKYAQIPREKNRPLVVTVEEKLEVDPDNMHSLSQSTPTDLGEEYVKDIKSLFLLSVKHPIS